ncbi:hypothetical protein H6G89_08610 [Oscillatoria sp. FACHB-1407]|nr:hypothetical protein [Oscillatoria sp. FACHB-1407]MBD2461102.1 hypothetical protein [Oscillatoria sp. FACHB-1407]
MQKRILNPRHNKVSKVSDRFVEGNRAQRREPEKMESEEALECLQYLF